MPLGIYLHIPFCVKKCLYCDFLSFPSDEDTRARYVDALLREIEAQAELYRDYRVETIFFGGGTPSLLTGEQMEAVMNRLAGCFHLGERMEVTMEMNPGTASPEGITAYRRAGVNRLSLGLQSARDEELRALGRIHTWDAFLNTYEAARAAGFGNVNVDLMSALPGQNMSSWLYSLERVAALCPEHISAYSLIVEEGTPFYALYGENGTAEQEGLALLPGEDEERRMYEQTRAVLEQAGYSRYEISNYARPGCECRHNSAYWRRVDYAGFGLGAASLRQNVRWSNTSDMSVYLAESGMSGLRTGIKGELQELGREDAMEEFMFLGLRMTEGVCAETFARTFGEELECIYEQAIAGLLRKGLLRRYVDPSGRSWFCLTERGVDVSNYALAEFLF